MSVWQRVNHYPITPAGEDVTLCLISLEWKNLSSKSRTELLSGFKRTEPQQNIRFIWVQGVLVSHSCWTNPALLWWTSTENKCWQRRKVYSVKCFENWISLSVAQNAYSENIISIVHVVSLSRLLNILLPSKQIIKMCQINVKFKIWRMLILIIISIIIKSYIKHVWERFWETYSKHILYSQRLLYLVVKAEQISWLLRSSPWDYILYSKDFKDFYSVADITVIPELTLTSPFVMYLSSTALNSLQMSKEPITG